MNLFKLALIALLSGCAFHIEKVEPPTSSGLSGSPCVDGLVVNLEKRCAEIYTRTSEDSFIQVTCKSPLSQDFDDSLYDGYAYSQFLIINNEKLDDYSRNPDVMLLCQDTVVTIGVTFPTNSVSE